MPLLLELKREAEHVVHLIRVVEHDDISADDRVPESARRGTVPPRQVIRQRVHLPAQLRVEPLARAKAALQGGRQAILLSPSGPEASLVPLVPVPRSLAVLIIEPGVMLAIPIGAILPGVLLDGWCRVLDDGWCGGWCGILRGCPLARHAKEGQRQCTRGHRSYVHELTSE